MKEFEGFCLIPKKPFYKNRALVSYITYRKSKYQLFISNILLEMLQF